MRWNERRARVRWWLEREGPAEEMLLFYLELLDLQESVYREALRRGWNEVPADGDRLDLTCLPVTDLVPRFVGFVGEIAPAAPAPLADAAASLLAAGDAAARELLDAFLFRRDAEGLPENGGATWEFFPRAYLQAIAEAAAGDGAVLGKDLPPTCPRCSRPPQVGALRDGAEARGERLLHCSLCATVWRFRRSVCPHCGEDQPDKLVHHTSDSLPHLRVDECQSCRVYLKTVDLRRDGQAVPLVDDLGSVELDVWAGEQGLRKLQPNVLGL